MYGSDGNYNISSLDDDHEGLAPSHHVQFVSCIGYDFAGVEQWEIPERSPQEPGGQRAGEDVMGRVLCTPRGCFERASPTAGG